MATVLSNYLKDKKVKKRTIYFIANIGKSYIEDFVDKDSGKIVYIERFHTEETAYMEHDMFYIHPPNKDTVITHIEIILKLYYKNMKLKKIISKKAYFNHINKLK